MNKQAFADELEYAIEAKKMSCQVLLASGDGAIKRRLGIMGDYKKHREKAMHAILEDAFYLVAAARILNGSWFLRWRYQRLLKKADKVMQGRMDLRARENEA